MNIEDVIQVSSQDIKMFEATGSDYGINEQSFDDGRIGYLPSRRAFYTCAKVKDNLFLVVGVAMNGSVLLSSLASGNMTNNLKNGEALMKEANVNMALSHFKKVFQMLLAILNKYRQKIKILRFNAGSSFQERRLAQFLNTGTYENALARYGYNPTDKEETEKQVSYIFTKS